MKVISINVGEEAVLKEVDGGLESFQKLVGGLIEFVGVTFDNKPYYLVVNEEGKLIQLPLNRKLLLNDKVVDIVVGNAFITHFEEGVGLGEEDLKIINKYVNLENIKL